MNAPYTLVRDDHYVVTETRGGKERVSFGIFLPLTQRAAKQWAKAHGGRVIKRTTARRSGIMNYSV
jgi:hypothetical protein